jgi:hypothetical protein
MIHEGHEETLSFSLCAFIPFVDKILMLSKQLIIPALKSVNTRGQQHGNDTHDDG